MDHQAAALQGEQQQQPVNLHLTPTPTPPNESTTRSTSASLDETQEHRLRLILHRLREEDHNRSSPPHLDHSSQPSSDFLRILASLTESQDRSQESNGSTWRSMFSGLGSVLDVERGDEAGGEQPDSVARLDLSHSSRNEFVTASRLLASSNQDIPNDPDPTVISRDIATQNLISSSTHLSSPISPNRSHFPTPITNLLTDELPTDLPTPPSADFDQARAQMIQEALRLLQAIDNDPSGLRWPAIRRYLDRYERRTRRVENGEVGRTRTRREAMVSLVDGSLIRLREGLASNEERREGDVNSEATEYVSPETSDSAEVVATRPAQTAAGVSLSSTLGEARLTEMRISGRPSVDTHRRDRSTSPPFRLRRREEGGSPSSGRRGLRYGRGRHEENLVARPSAPTPFEEGRSDSDGNGSSGGQESPMLPGSVLENWPVGRVRLARTARGMRQREARRFHVNGITGSGNSGSSAPSEWSSSQRLDANGDVLPNSTVQSQRSTVSLRDVFSGPPTENPMEIIPRLMTAIQRGLNEMDRGAESLQDTTRRQTSSQRTTVARLRSVMDSLISLPSLETGAGVEDLSSRLETMSARLSVAVNTLRGDIPPPLEAVADGDSTPPAPISSTLSITTGTDGRTDRRRRLSDASSAEYQTRRQRRDPASSNPPPLTFTRTPNSDTLRPPSLDSSWSHTFTDATPTSEDNPRHHLFLLGQLHQMLGQNTAFRPPTRRTRPRTRPHPTDLIPKDRAEPNQVTTACSLSKLLDRNGDPVDRSGCDADSIMRVLCYHYERPFVDGTAAAGWPASVGAETTTTGGWNLWGTPPQTAPSVEVTGIGLRWMGRGRKSTSFVDR
ncbi:hypothetical protein BC829DRAFT_400126 [Chytridium lagenaria]|nr:hypothetical protein BC829DRAFT_400126 [Chytridium lagenaria]